jgi:hypothetical protein
MLLVIAWSEAEKPINSLVRPDKKAAPKYGLQAVPVCSLMSFLTLLTCVPEMLHAVRAHIAAFLDVLVGVSWFTRTRSITMTVMCVQFAWYHSNRDLSCAIQHHGIVINVAPTIFVAMLTLMNFSYFIRGGARVHLIQALNLTPADRRVAVWPTYRGFILTEIAKAHQQTNANQPLVATPSRGASAGIATNAGPDQKGDEIEAEVRAASHAKNDSLVLNMNSPSAKFKKLNRPVLGLDAFDPANIRYVPHPSIRSSVLPFTNNLARAVV